MFSIVYVSYEQGPQQRGPFRVSKHNPMSYLNNIKRLQTSSIKSGRKLTWWEQFVWMPLITFAAKFFVVFLVTGTSFLFLLLIVKLIKWMWFL